MHGITKTYYIAFSRWNFAWCNANLLRICCIHYSKTAVSILNLHRQYWSCWTPITKSDVYWLPTKSPFVRNSQTYFFWVRKKKLYRWWIAIFHPDLDLIKPICTQNFFSPHSESIAQRYLHYNSQCRHIAPCAGTLCRKIAYWVVWFLVIQKWNVLPINRQPTSCNI